jgi:hypothetical protein
MKTISNDELNRIYAWACEGEDAGGRFPGMTYENGIKDMVDLLQDNLDIDDLLEE